MKITYEETTSVFGNTIIKADLGDGRVLFIPDDPANSDYQAYLKRDEPQVEHLTDAVE
jgi:hypothetical protein